MLMIWDDPKKLLRMRSFAKQTLIIYLIRLDWLKIFSYLCIKIMLLTIITIIITACHIIYAGKTQKIKVDLRWGCARSL